MFTISTSLATQDPNSVKKQTIQNKAKIIHCLTLYFQKKFFFGLKFLPPLLSLTISLPVNSHRRRIPILTKSKTQKKKSNPAVSGLRET